MARATILASLLALTATLWAVQDDPKPSTPVAPYSVAGTIYEPDAPLKATQVPTGPPAPEGAIRTFTITYASANGATVPADLALPGGKVEGKRPAVLLLHGLGGDRKQLALLAALLNGKGYVTLSIDAAGHGARPRIADKTLAELDLAQVRTLGAQTVIDLRRAVDYLQSRPEVDAKKIAFLGVSLGGILGARFLSDEPRIAAGVLWATGGDWGKLLTTSQVDTAKRLRARGFTDPVAIEKELEAIDPLRTLSHAPPRPLLFLNGDKDDIVPPACTEALYLVAPEPKERIILPGGHIPNALEMASRSIGWLDKKLK